MILWPTKIVEVNPFAVCDLATVSTKILKRLAKIGVTVKIRHLKKTELFRNVHFLERLCIMMVTCDLNPLVVVNWASTPISCKICDFCRLNNRNNTVTTNTTNNNINNSSNTNNNNNNNNLNFN